LAAFASKMGWDKGINVPSLPKDAVVTKSGRTVERYAPSYSKLADKGKDQESADNDDGEERQENGHAEMDEAEERKRARSDSLTRSPPLANDFEMDETRTQGTDEAGLEDPMD